MCELLLDCGACVNAQTRGGATPLHRAAYCGHYSVLQLLLDRGADPCLTDDDGSTPLHKVLNMAIFDEFASFNFTQFLIELLFLNAEHVLLDLSDRP